MFFSNKKLMLRTGLAAFFSAMFLTFGFFAYTMSIIPEMFRLNKVCQEEGYYMAEFEFKMLTFAYYLDRGNYFKASHGIHKLYYQLKSRRGLIKVPDFKDKYQEMDFYLNLQNPRTGAFMDDAFPLFAYHGPSENVLLHLEALAKETGQPLRLKYPLKYLDEINTPPKLKAFLDDVSTVGRFASKLPQTTFTHARDLIALSDDKNIINRRNLYSFSSEWKRVLLSWFYEHQDSETGFWGPKSEDGRRLQRLDLNNTVSIVKYFVDENGNNIYSDFPLRHRNEMFSTALKVLSRPTPAEDELDEWHEWRLENGKGLMLLLRNLWHDASSDQKEKAKQLIEDYVKILFEKLYIADEGAFSLYPGARHASLDGGGGPIDIFKRIGAFSRAKRCNLWGLSEDDDKKRVFNHVSHITAEHFNAFLNFEEINSIRFYSSKNVVEDYTSNLAAIIYPQNTLYLDAMDLMPKFKQWILTTSQKMGNWESKDVIINDTLEDFKTLEAAPVFKGKIPLKAANDLLKRNNELTVIGFDILQMPIYQIRFVSG